ncbi:MAG: hypothetical protein AAFX02_06235 [Pseudomonadota bacterium]
MDAFDVPPPAGAADGGHFYREEGNSLSLGEDEGVNQKLIADVLGALKNRDIETASHRANVALRLDVANPRLQFLNGYVYHQMALSGDTSKFELAEQGYLQALRFDPGNLRAQYQLGQLYMAQRRFGLAKGYFAAVVLDDENNPAALYNLATAAYYARDPVTAEVVLGKLLDTAPELAEEPEIIQAVAIAKAAVNDPVGASVFLGRSSNLENIAFVQRRLNNWSDFYRHDFASQMPSLVQPASITETVAENADEEMVVVDVVLIGMQEDARRSRGINLLDGLQLQFGDALDAIPGFSFGATRVFDRLNVDGGLDENTQTITQLINIPAVTYSLNIANSLDSFSEILAKPSLVAMDKETSEFFSGTEVLAAAVSGGDGDSVSVEKEVGVKLAVTPTILDNGKVRLHVVAERTFLTDPSNSVLFEFRLDTTKTTINSTVTMNFDETLILGGLTERETTKSDSGVPIIRDVPGINLLFSEKASREFERSILILLTPRRSHFTNRSTEDRQAKLNQLSSIERDIERFERRHDDWFVPRAVFSELLDNLRGTAFAEEFRMDDLPVREWKRKNSGFINDADDLETYLLSDGV